MAGNHNANPVVPDQARIIASGTARPMVVAEQRSSAGVGLQVRKPKRNAFTLAKQAKFFARLAETSNVKAAAEHAGVCPTTIWNWRRKDAEFARAWAMALAQGYADLEMRMLAQARFGATSEAEVIVEDDGKRRARARRDTPGHGRLMLMMHNATVRSGEDGGDDEAANDDDAAAAPVESIDALIARLRDALTTVIGRRGTGTGTDTGSGADD